MNEVVHLRRGRDLVLFQIDALSNGSLVFQRRDSGLRFESNLTLLRKRIIIAAHLSIYSGIELWQLVPALLS